MRIFHPLIVSVKLSAVTFPSSWLTDRGFLKSRSNSAVYFNIPRWNASQLYLIIDIVLVVKKRWLLNKTNRWSWISSSDIPLPSIYFQLWKKYEHIFRVFRANKCDQEDHVTYPFAEKTKVSSYKCWREKRKSKRHWEWNSRAVLKRVLIVSFCWSVKIACKPSVV